jgi:membrane-associated phospholipid phosphatase
VKLLFALSALAASAAVDLRGPYVLPADMPDLAVILPAPPALGSADQARDRATFASTRALEGTARWELATRDVTSDRFETFACALGARLDARSAPALARLYAHLSDVGMVGRAKDTFAVLRPYLGTDQPICEAKTAHLAGNGDYPSGHTSNGWATALVLAELLPERATAILTRGRQYGESRYICGSHSRSAVDAGYISGAVLVARLHASPEFRRDLDAARAELPGALARFSTKAPACLPD